MTALAGVRVLVLDAEPPHPGRDSGSLRMMGILEALGELGCQVAFGYTGAARGWHAEPPCGRALEGDEQVAAEVDRGAYDVALLSRPEVASAWIERVRRAAPAALVAYDTVDLHFVREFRGAKVSGSATRLRNAVALRTRELALARSADLTLVVSEPERNVLQDECRGARVEVVSNVHPLGPPGEPFAGRSGFLFVGNYAHTPNVDAVHFLLGEVWPLMDGAELTIVGADPPEVLRVLAGSGVTFAGHVPSLEPLLGSAAAMVAPLRFGAGVKGKVLLAMAHGLPVVGTTVALEGIGDGSQAAVADDAPGLAAALARVAGEEAEWSRLATAGRQLVERQFSPAAARAALARALAPALEGARA